MTDQTAAPRPVPTFADRTATDAPLPTWLPDALEELRAERVKTGRLEGDLRSLAQAVREALAERDAARNDAKQAAQLAAFRQGVIDRHRQELGAAGDVLAVVRDAAERIDRALATYDTTPGEEPEPDPDALSEPQPPDLASWGEREVIAGLRTGAAHRTLQLGAANLIERLIRERGVAPLGSPAPRAQEEPVAVNLGERIRVLHPSPGGCDRCSVEPGERHRYPECPGNRRDAEARP